MSSSSTLGVTEAIENHGLILGQYINMARVIAEMFDPVVETVVHDLNDPDHSIIAIFNGHLTGRKVGDPATDIVSRLVSDDFPDVLVGYENESPNGQRLKSTSLAIRDDEFTLIGVMGLNMDVSYFDDHITFMKRFIARTSSRHVLTPERFSTSPDGVPTPKEDIQQAIRSFVTSRNWTHHMLSYKKKREIVEYLYANGYFKSRGAVTIIANELGLTRASVYNYKNDYIERTKVSKKSEDV